jgi:hypothetical protein
MQTAITEPSQTFIPPSRENIREFAQEMLHSQNTHCHLAGNVQGTLLSMHWTVLHYPSCLCDFHLTGPLKIALKGI